MSDLAGEIGYPEETPRVAVRGWLLFFCIGLAIFAPLSFISGMNRALVAGPGVLAVTYGFIGLTSLVAGIMLWSVARPAFLFLRIHLIVRFLYILFQYFTAVVLTSHHGLSSISVREWTTAVVNTIGLLVTFLYFRVSKRVLATYGRNL